MPTSYPTLGSGAGSTSLIPASYVARKVGSTYEAKSLSGFPNYAATSSLSGLFASMLGNTGIGKIHLLAGAYSLDAMIQSTLDQIEIEGEGQKTQVTLANGVNQSAMIEFNSSKIHIHDILLDGNYANQASGLGHGILADTDGKAGHYIGPHVYIQNCYGDGLHVGRSTWGSTGNMGGVIEGSFIVGNQANGLYQDYSATDWQIWGNLITTSTNAGMASIVENAGSCRFSLNHLWGSYYDIILAPSKSIYRSEWIGNGIMDCKRHGIYWAGSATVRDSIFTGNMFWSHGRDAADTYSTFYLNGSGGFNYNTIVGNTGYGYKEDIPARYTKNFVNDVSGKITYSTIANNTLDYYTDANPIIVQDKVTNILGPNIIAECGL